MRDIKIRYVYSNGANIFTKCFTLEQIEAGDHFNEICDCPLLRDYKIIDRLQYTGLKDKNGVEIYDGDILSGNSKLNFGAVMFKNGSYWIKGSHHKGDGVTIYNEAIYAHELTIIGNIHETPELLEQHK